MTHTQPHVHHIPINTQDNTLNYFISIRSFKVRGHNGLSSFKLPNCTRQAQRLEDLCERTLHLRLGSRHQEPSRRPGRLLSQVPQPNVSSQSNPDRWLPQHRRIQAPAQLQRVRVRWNGKDNRFGALRQDENASRA